MALSYGRTATTVLWLGLGVLGCGGGSSSHPDGTPPTILSTSPANTAMDVDPGDDIRAAFSEDINETTLTDNTFRLYRPDNTVVQGSVTYNATTMEAVFRPNEKLSFLTSYLAVLTKGIADRSGNPLSSDYTWQFSTRERTWGPATRIGPDTGSSHSAKVAIDSAGNATAVWHQSDGQAPSTIFRILASRFVPDRGWGAPVRIDDDRSAYADYPELDVDANGNVIAVWQKESPDPNLTYLMWWNRFSDTAWGNPTIIDPLATAAALPRIRMGDEGDGMAWWLQREGQDRFGGVLYGLYANRYEPNTVWGPTVHLRANIDPQHHPDVALSRKGGSAMAVWRHFDGSVWAMPFEPNSGWGPPTQLTGLGDYPQVVVGEDGTGMAIWTGFNGTSSALYSARYEKNVGWESPIEVALMKSQGKIVIDQSGNVTAVWVDVEFSGGYEPGCNNVELYRLHALRYKIGSGWGGDTPSPVLTRTCKLGPLHIPQVAVDGQGNVMVVWSDWVNILVQRYSAESDLWDRSWVLNDETSQATSPHIAANDHDDAVVVWHQPVAGKITTWASMFNE